MDITFSFTQCETQLDPETGMVNAVLLALTGSASEVINEQTVNYGGTIDGRVSLEPKVTYTAEELRAIAMQYAVSNGWFENVRGQIERDKGAPVPGSKFVI